MPLVSGIDLLQKAHKYGYAVGAFSIDNINSIEAVLRTAEKMESPVILQTGQATLRQTQINYLAAIVKEMVSEVKIPVALHLDHGTGLSQSVQAVRSGYTSLMYDGSRLNIDQNILITKKIREIASTLNLSLEAELGKLGTKGKEEIHQLTDPNEAEMFVRATNVDSIAVALGNIHASYEEKVKINLNHLQLIHKRVGIPIVLHGGTGVSDDDIKGAISKGVSKVNIATEWRRATIDFLREQLINQSNNDFFVINQGVTDTISKIVEEKIKLFGSAGKA